MSQSKQSFEEFSNECLKHLSGVQDAFMNRYDINSYEHWYYDHGIGAFHFKSDDGRNLYFKYVDVGSYSTTRNTWMWSWDNDSTPKHVTKGLEKVRRFA